MSLLPRLEIRQTFAKIGVETKRAQLEIQQFMGEQSVRQESAKLDIHSPEGSLTIDSTRARDAYVLGGVFLLNSRIASESYKQSVEAIGKIAQKGNRLAAIHLNQNPIPEMAEEALFEQSHIKYAGEAGIDNVDISYQPQKPVIEIEMGEVIHQYIPRKPEIKYNKGMIEFYLRVKNQIHVKFHTVDKKV